MRCSEGFFHQEAEDLPLIFARESDYVFGSQSADTVIPVSAGAESPPTGGDSEPNGSRLLVAHIGVAIRLSVVERCCRIKDQPC